MRLFTAITLAAVAVSLCGADWLQFRGDNGTASAGASSAPPTKWTDEEGLAWKVKVAGKGVSSPIVVGGHVIVTANEGPKQERLLVLAFGADDGKLAWRREFWATGRTASHPTSANAAPTPASDGKHIYAFFSSNDLICLDLDGNLIWYRGLAHDYPKAGNDIGMASSPLVVGDTVVVQIENQGDSFAAGIDKSTGLTKWRVSRPASANWASPIALPNEKGELATVLLQSGTGLNAVDPQTGVLRWNFEQPCATVASAATAPGLVYLPSNGTTVLSVSDDASAPDIVWDSNRVSPGSASVVVEGNRLYVVGRSGVVTCADRANGDVLWQHRLRGTFWGTPVFAGGHLYAVNQDGKAFVVDVRAEKPKTVFEVDLGESVMASPAVVGNALFIRSASTLWKIAAN